MEYLIGPLFIQAWLVGIGLAVMAGPLGCFLIWRRAAYLGDAMTHVAVLGVAMGVLLQLDVLWGVLGVVLIFSAILMWLSERQQLPGDTWLAIISQFALASALVLVSLFNIRVDLMGLLFGDILAIGRTDLMVVSAVVILTIVLYSLLWRSLLASLIHEEIAKTEGRSTKLVQGVLILLVATMIAIGIKIIGALLMIALLIIPAATARFFSKTPEQMVVLASLFGVIAVSLGLLGSFEWDLPSGPAIVISAVLLGAIVLALRGVVQRIKNSWF